MVNEMPRYDLTVEQIMDIIDYLEVLRRELLSGQLVSLRDNPIEHIDDLISTLKKIKL